MKRTLQKGIMCQLVKLIIILLITNIERYTLVMHGFLQGIGTTYMSVGLIVFGDKSHTDLHRALSLTPIIFTLTLFNHAAQNDSKFCRPIGYIPNLGYGRGTSNKNLTRDEIQDEHSCISFDFQSFKNINKENGFQCVVLGHAVRVKVWIHFFI
jgi:hypothetical protein